MSASAKKAPFERLDIAAADGLLDCRLALHWAAQIASAAGATLAEAAADYSHTALTWLDGPGALVGVPLSDGRRAGLRIRDLSIVVIDAAADVRAQLSLTGRSLADGLEWLGEQLGSTLERPTHDLPAHPVADGAAFPAARAADLEQLARWFGDAARILGTVTDAEEHASPVRCWPHHFDIATLIALDPDESDAEKARSIGVGMTPGDAANPAPYFYVTPWPYPSTDSLPPLRGNGRWNTEGWVGALLPAAEVAASDAAEQSEQVLDFVRSAIDASRSLSI